MIKVVFTPPWADEIESDLKVFKGNYGPDATAGISFWDDKNNYRVACIIHKDQDMEGIVKDIRSWADEIESDLKHKKQIEETM